jgi:hypothetical protein
MSHLTYPRNGPEPLKPRAILEVPTRLEFDPQEDRLHTPFQMISTQELEILVRPSPSRGALGSLQKTA